jgi:hypothetical protein
MKFATQRQLPLSFAQRLDRGAGSSVRVLSDSPRAVATRREPPRATALRSPGGVSSGAARSVVGRQPERSVQPLAAAFAKATSVRSPACASTIAASATIQPLAAARVPAALVKNLPAVDQLAVLPGSEFARARIRHAVEVLGSGLLIAAFLVLALFG